MKFFKYFTTAICLIALPAVSIASAFNAAAEANGNKVIYVPDDIERMVETGDLFHLTDTNNYIIDQQVSRPYATWETKSFLEQISEEFAAQNCGKVQVNGLARAKSDPKPNRYASDTSAHYRGMAIDIDIPAEKRCARWLRERLGKAASRDHIRFHEGKAYPHFHAAIEPSTDMSELTQVAKVVKAVADGPVKVTKKASAQVTPAKPVRESYSGKLTIRRVRTGESFETIAAVHNISASELMRLNRSSYLGYVVLVPAE